MDRNAETRYLLKKFFSHLTRLIGPTPDLLFTEEDMSRPNILRLKIKKDGE